jgi:formylglycine-generating enzyme required for sulfatase activity
MAATATTVLACACNALIGLQAAIPPPDAGVTNDLLPDAARESDVAVSDAFDAELTIPADTGIHAQQSCTPGGAGLDNCGPDGGTESCCANPEVMGGTYYRTYTNAGAGVTGQTDEATVSSFRLDKYEVTVGRFRQFVSAWNQGKGWLPYAGSGKHTHLNGGAGLTNCLNPGHHEQGWIASDDSNVAPTAENLACNAPYSTWTPSPATNENLPINCVSWYEAYAFCIWDGGFLPTEAEWGYAAADGSEEREYPWGETPPGAGSEYAIYDDFYPTGTMTPDGSNNIAPVGTALLGASAAGQLDLAGNVWEWNLDWFDEFVEPSVDCADLTATLEQVRALRGGYFAGQSVLATSRDETIPATRAGGVGFRCARSP